MVSMRCLKGSVAVSPTLNISASGQAAGLTSQSAKPQININSNCNMAFNLWFIYTVFSIVPDVTLEEVAFQRSACEITAACPF